MVMPRLTKNNVIYCFYELNSVVWSDVHTRLDEVTPHNTPCPFRVVPHDGSDRKWIYRAFPSSRTSLFRDSLCQVVHLLQNRRIYANIFDTTRKSDGLAIWSITNHGASHSVVKDTRRWRRWMQQLINWLRHLALISVRFNPPSWSGRCNMDWRKRKVFILQTSNATVILAVPKYWEQVSVHKFSPLSQVSLK
jgi:hypothetical protein